MSIISDKQLLDYLNEIKKKKLTQQYADEFEYLLKLLKEKDTYTVITHLKNVMEHYDLKDEDKINW